MKNTVTLTASASWSSEDPGSVTFAMEGSRVGTPMGPGAPRWLGRAVGNNDWLEYLSNVKRWGVEWFWKRHAQKI